MKETLLLCERRGSFLETFASPGYIVEGPGTMVKTLMNCSAKCHYCYLNRTAIRQMWQKIYVNTEHLEQELLNEIPIHTGLMTVLSLSSLYGGETLLKIPVGFKELSDDIRNKLSGRGRNIVSNIDVYEYLNENIEAILPQLDEQLNTAKFRVKKQELKNAFNQNKKLPFSFNVSEYSDILGIEHIAGHLDFMSDLTERNPEFNMRFFTKFANIDTLLKHNGDNRVKVIMNYNPQSIIDSYEEGTASLDDRIKAHAAIQAIGGYRTVVLIEPAITFTGYEKEYVDLIGEIFKKVDAKKIDKVALGMVRYTGQLLTFMGRFYPDSGLIDNKYELRKPIYGYDRYRYDFDERISFYQMMIAEIRKYTTCPITLGAETPETWEALKLNPQTILDKEFYQVKIK
jgi:DNA repair photolyase